MLLYTIKVVFGFFERLFWSNEWKYSHILIGAFDFAQSQDLNSLSDYADFFQNYYHRVPSTALNSAQEGENVVSQSVVDSGDKNSNVQESTHESPKAPSLVINESLEDAKGGSKAAPNTKSWIPSNIGSTSGGKADISRDSNFIKYRLNNPRVTKKGDKTVSEGMCNAYFEQRRNVLTQMLDSFADSEVVIHPLAKKKAKSNCRKTKSVGSIYRGVSKNKHKWQVMIMGNFKKFYIGGIKTELEAAKLYDKLAIFYHGMEAKTNFKYTKGDIEILISEPMEH